MFPTEARTLAEDRARLQDHEPGFWDRGSVRVRFLGWKTSKTLLVL